MNPVSVEGPTRDFPLRVWRRGRRWEGCPALDCLSVESGVLPPPRNCYRLVVSSSNPPETRFPVPTPLPHGPSLGGLSWGPTLVVTGTESWTLGRSVGRTISKDSYAPYVVLRSVLQKTKSLKNLQLNHESVTLQSEDPRTKCVYTFSFVCVYM